MSNAGPTVFVVDDDLSVRRALERLLQAAGLEVCSHATAQDYLDHYDPDAPGCVVLDLAMPGLSGLELQDALLARGVPPPIVFLTGRAGVPDSVQALKHGAVEFLTKPVDETTLVDAVRKAFESDRIERAARTELAGISRRLSLLTARETQVLRCIVAGLLNKQTAAELGMAEKTVKVHRARIMEKMQARSFAELIQLAARAGITARSSR